jgi:hypothetical protein
MEDWSKEEIEEAKKRICKVHSGLVYPFVVGLQCEVIALRGALQDALPILEEELKTLERSFLPVPDEAESILLATCKRSTEQIQRLLIRIQG